MDSAIRRWLPNVIQRLLNGGGRDLAIHLSKRAEERRDVPMPTARFEWASLCYSLKKSNPRVTTALLQILISCRSMCDPTGVHSNNLNNPALLDMLRKKAIDGVPASQYHNQRELYRVALARAVLEQAGCPIEHEEDGINWNLTYAENIELLGGLLDTQPKEGSLEVVWKLEEDFISLPTLVPGGDVLIPEAVAQQMESLETLLPSKQLNGICKMLTMHLTPGQGDSLCEFLSRDAIADISDNPTWRFLVWAASERCYKISMHHWLESEDAEQVLKELRDSWKLVQTGPKLVFIALSLLGYCRLKSSIEKLRVEDQSQTEDGEVEMYEEDIGEGCEALILAQDLLHNFVAGGAEVLASAIECMVSSLSEVAPQKLLTVDRDLISPILHQVEPRCSGTHKKLRSYIEDRFYGLDHKTACEEISLSREKGQ
uniref:Uncharacterized protein n=2 Tax=Colletotrichum fructicola (strain Nara gc5) TaxID=1213859 RepID=L2FIW8_COLFN